MMSGRKPFVSGYYSPAGMVLDLGCRMPTSRKIVPCGRMKECYSNAQTLAIHDPSLKYAEGWAVRMPVPFPVLHAWCVDANGSAVDPTWCAPRAKAPSGRKYGRRKYFGVIIDTDYLVKRLVATKTHHPLIDDWEHGWPLLSKRGLAKKVIKKCRKRSSR